MPELRGQGYGASGRASRRYEVSDPTFVAVMAETMPLDELDYEGDTLERVYFALDSDAAQVKIGWTRNVDRRLIQLRQQRQRPIELLGTLDGGYNLERSLHQQFATYRREAREWYSTEILPLVSDLLEAA